MIRIFPVAAFVVIAGTCCAQDTSAVHASIDSTQACTLNRQQAVIDNFYLGMSLQQALKLFADVPELKDFSQHHDVYVHDESGQMVVSAHSEQNGYQQIDVGKGYADKHLQSAKVVPGLAPSTLGFSNGKLVAIRIAETSSNEWNNLQQFVVRASQLFAWPMLWKEKRPPDPGPGNHDFWSATYEELDCRGFNITASCVGPPERDGFCGLAMGDTEISTSKSN